MRLLIVGVGQTLNFETGEMEDMLQVLAPDGSTFSIPTTNDAAQGLVKLAMNGNGHQEEPQMRLFRAESGHTAYDQTGEISGEPAEEIPEGAEVFGGERELFQQVQETLVSRSRGVSQRMDDRSGIPSRSLSANLVDERGNPVMAHVPEDSMEEEDDPGEQI